MRRDTTPPEVLSEACMRIFRKWEIITHFFFVSSQSYHYLRWGSEDDKEKYATFKKITKMFSSLCVLVYSDFRGHRLK